MKKRWISLLLVFLCLISGTNLASGQVEATVTVIDTTLASGDTYQQVTVKLQNDVPVKGINLAFDLERQADTDFTTDRIIIQIDTVSLDPLEIDTSAVRECKIQTAGTLVENFEWITAHGTLGDTAFLDCDRLVVAGMAHEGNPIPPGEGVLLKLYVDVLCIPDTTQDRAAYLIVNGSLSDPEAQTLETQFNFGTLILDQTFCGTLIECMCGDVNADEEVTIVDVVYMINWLFNSGHDLCPEMMGEANPVRGVSISDVVYLINFVFNSGPEPKCARKY